ncbi:MAG: MmgE/PrpD family protein, partial [Lachnospiraceae bacterium]|nr:MmgE/PrpD family protein [Lachnospiraceae bacterium]
MEVPRLNYSDEFVKTLYTLSRKEITPELQAEARKCLLDGLGSLYGGMELMRKHVDAYLDQLPEVPGGATVIGHERRASMQDAALTNGLSLHVLDMDDGHRFSTVHLAASVIPAVLSVGEVYELSMDDMIRGLLVGYETGIRMGRCIQPANRARGFHSSGTAGTLGAAMGVAAMLDLSKEQMKDTLAAACTSAGGLLEVMENVSTMKPFNPARACHAGITAALIA